MNRGAQSSGFYTLLQRRLHWLVIILLITQYTLQGSMRNALAAIEAQETIGFSQFLVTTVHTWGGITIAALMLWRWQLRKRKVAVNGGQLSRKNQRLVEIHHLSLYVATNIMVVSGATHYYLDWQFAGRWHELGKWVLLVLILIHAIGAFWHAWQGSTVLQRMMGKNSLR